jgi:hypothetical protein
MIKKIQQLDNGDLQFTLTNVSFADYRELVQLKNDNPYEQWAFEALTEREYYALPDDKYGELGLLTSSPILVSIDYWSNGPDNEEFMIEMGGLQVWYFPNYAMENAFETLIKKGTVVFKNAEN